MENEATKLWATILITAVVVGGGTYYFLKSDIQSATSVITDTARTTYNKTSKEYAVMGREFWSAFQCASWASISEDTTEQERLFTYGYERGKEFIGALTAKKVEEEDISQEVPIAVTMLLQGPSPDFMLGMIFDTAQENALEDVFKTGNEYNSDEMQKIVAENKFRDGNCQLIGR